MKKLLSIGALAALTLIATSQVVLAGPNYKPGSKPAPKPAYKPSYKPAYKPSYKPTYKPTAYKPTYKPTVYKPTYKPTAYKPTYKPTVYKPNYKPSTYKPGYKPSVYKPVYKPSIYKPGYKPVAVLKPVKFRYGVYYSGKTHYHWTKRYYSARWRNWFFWDPRTQVWYYWYATGARYYPVSVITTYTPTEAVLPCPGEEVTAGTEESGLLDVPQAQSGEEPDLPEPPGTTEPDDE
jgi:hypothetical protein